MTVLSIRHMNNNKKLRLVVIPSDPLETYKSAGYAGWLKDYYNPLNFFDEVYLLSPLETVERYEFGMKIIPTQPEQFKNRIKELNIDVIRAYGGYWACDMACNNKVNGIPVVISVHDTNPNNLNNSINRADIVFCVSEAVLRLVKTNFRRSDRLWILPNRVNFDTMRPYPEWELKDLDGKYPFKHKILHVGRKAKQKNIDTLIKALKILGNAYCVIAIGKGNIEEYVELAKKESVIKQCYFIDSIENEELARYYSWADCMCTPSRWEGFGIVFIEALACEAVVVTSNVAPMNEYIASFKNGLLIQDYEDPYALSEMIELACNDKQLREIIKKNARESIKKFEKSKIDQLEVDYYKKILEMSQNKEFIMPEKLFQKIWKGSWGK